MKAIDEAHLSSDNVKIAAHCSNLGHFFSAQQKHEEALGYYKKSIDIYIKCFPNKDNMALAQAFDNAGDICMHLGLYDDAETYLLQAIEICENLDDEQVSLLRNIAFLYAEQKRFTEAQDHLMRALQLAEKLVGKKSLELVPICNNLGAMKVGLDDLDAAIIYYRRGLEILKTSFAMVRYSIIINCFPLHIYLLISFLHIV